MVRLRGKISKYRSHVARCLFFGHDRADITFAVNELRQKMSDPSQHSFTKLKRLVSVLEERERRDAMDPSVFELGDEFRGDALLRLRLGWRQRNEEIVKRRSRGTCDDTF